VGRGKFIKLVYDVVGVAVTMLTANYIATAFVVRDSNFQTLCNHILIKHNFCLQLMDFWISVRLLASFYFVPHIAGLLVMFVLPLVLRPPRSARDATHGTKSSVESELKNVAKDVIEGAADAASGIKRRSPGKARPRLD
jgi:hypothetical protein